MPSPFPGMDPYLEVPSLWPGLLLPMAVYIADTLQPLLTPRYYAEVCRRECLTEPAEAGHPGQSYLEIRTLASHEVVAVLELVSPASKGPGSKAREEYVSRQECVLASAAHLIEIDLLRRGDPVVVGAPTSWALPAFDYLAGVNRATDRFRSELYPFTVRDHLPRMRIPLREPDADVTLDLPAVFQRCYDNGTYARRVDYNQPPPESLRPEDAEWTDGLLRAAGLRKILPAAAEEQG